MKHKMRGMQDFTSGEWNAQCERCGTSDPEEVNCLSFVEWLYIHGLDVLWKLGMTINRKIRE